MNPWNLVMKQATLLISVLEVPDAELPDELNGVKEANAKRVLMARMFAHRLHDMIQGTLAMQEAASMFEQFGRAQPSMAPAETNGHPRQPFGFAAGRTKA